MDIEILKTTGESAGKYTLSKTSIVDDINVGIISQYTYSYLSNQRQANADTKDRSEVRGGGKKPWRQKGTGRARFGSSRVPIWRGGGVTFGPTSDRNYKKKLNKKFKTAVLKNILTQVVNENRLKVLESISIESEAQLTKQAISILGALGFENGKVTIVTENKNDTLVNAFSNVQNATVTFYGELSAYDLLFGGTIIIEKAALEKLEEKLK